MPEGQTVRFDGWTLHKDVGELARDGRRLRLQDQPYQVLDELLAHPGELVTREQLIARLWPKVVVDYDTGLNSAVRKLRIALGDVAETPRYIETVPRRGYRFVGTIDPPVAPAPSVVAAPSTAADADDQSRLHFGRAGRLGAYALAAASVAAIATALLWAVPRLSDSGRVGPASVTDGPGVSRGNVAARSLAVLPLHTSATDDAGVLLAQSVTDLLRNRFASLGNLTVIASSSTIGLTDSRVSLQSIGEQLQVEVVLQGRADRDGDRLRLELQLVDVLSGKRLWSGRFDRPLTEIDAVREQIFKQVAGVLHVPVEPAATLAPPVGGISFDAYALYVRGQELLAHATVQGAHTAVELFRRATILDPAFARAYLGLGRAILAADNEAASNGRLDGWVVARPGARESEAQAARAIERALELNPALGEAWIERARLTRDPVEAEKQFRRGLELAPNHAEGHAHYARFLFRQTRIGEAIETITRASQIDPLTPGPYEIHAFLLMVARSDVAGHDRLLRKALAINPSLPGVLRQLAHSRWEYSGEFADAAQLIERAIAADPNFAPSRALARDIYLDLGDRAAAADVLGGSPTPDSNVELAQYDGDRRRAATLASRVVAASWRESTGSHAPLAEAIRDGAAAAGRWGPAVQLLGSAQVAAEEYPRMWSRGLALVYAHTLVLAGEVERGRQHAAATLALVETHGVGRTEDWFSRERAAAFAVLGEDEQALNELEASVRTGKLHRWWYVAGHDPLFEHLRARPRFQALDKDARRHLERQRALLEEMRRKGVVPKRGG